MPAVPIPADDDLRRFLLGTLPADRVEYVRTWLDADSLHASRLDRIAANDLVMDAIFDSTTEEPALAGAVERIIRNLFDSVATLSAPTIDTPALTAESETATHLEPHLPGSIPPSLPARLGEYRVVRELGHGGMGIVFEVEDEKLGRRVAVKVLNPDLARKPGSVDRFLREARAAAAVEHDNVVPILHIGEEAGAPYIVMPLLKGESLSAQLKRDGKLLVTEVIRICRNVAAGLAAAHVKGLVHRDLKPGNIWLDADTGRARVLDFGLARQADGEDALTESGTPMGTPAYMSPEQLDGKPASVRSDLFGLGAVVYECATGHRAFDGPTITAIMRAVCDHHPAAPSEVNPNVPDELSSLIVRLLAKSPAEAPTSAAEVLAALANSNSALTAGNELTVTWMDREQRPKKRPRTGRSDSAVRSPYRCVSYSESDLVSFSSTCWVRRGILLIPTVECLLPLVRCRTSNRRRRDSAADWTCSSSESTMAVHGCFD